LTGIEVRSLFKRFRCIIRAGNSVNIFARSPVKPPSAQSTVVKVQSQVHVRGHELKLTLPRWGLPKRCSVTTSAGGG